MMRMSLSWLIACLLPGSLLLAGCDRQETNAPDEPKVAPFASTYVAMPASAVVIRGATVLTGTGEQLENASLVLSGGKIAALGQDVETPSGATEIDATGKWITPGLIDVHSHLGVYASPEHEANADGNEISDPNTAQVWAEHGVWPQDPQFPLALAGGVTTMQILPGSANLFGGRGVTLKNRPARTVQAMKFPNAPHSLKMACGENPKRVYGRDREGAPTSRMGNVAGYRAAWTKAREYARKHEDYEANTDNGEEAEPPERDLQLETLAEVLRGNILVHNHCYRADEMAVMLDVAWEFGYKVTAFHHAVEAYKIADLLAAAGTCAAMWPEWWGFKAEAYDMVEENVALVDRAGACAIVHSDSAITTQHLNQEAAKVMAAANKSGMSISRAKAITWITLNAAKALGIDAVTGSIETGKNADVVLWDGDPFSVYSKAERVFLDGALVFDRLNVDVQPVTDFELGIIEPQRERL